MKNDYICTIECKDSKILMHRIYFERRCIIICSPDEQALSDPNAVEFHFGERIDIHTLVAMFEASESLSRIYIPTDNTAWMYRRVCAEFREVDAAGGLVSNRRGDYLLIQRSGLWDLPKGHREAGEDIEAHLVVRHALHRPGGPHPAARRRHLPRRLGGPLQPAPLPEEHLSFYPGSLPRSESIRRFITHLSQRSQTNDIKYCDLEN